MITEEDVNTLASYACPMFNLEENKAGGSDIKVSVWLKPLVNPENSNGRMLDPYSIEYSHDGEYACNHDGNVNGVETLSREDSLLVALGRLARRRE